MRFLILTWVLLSLSVTSVSALEIEAPPVPDAAAQWMPDPDTSFPEALLELMERTLMALHPDFTEAVAIARTVLSLVICISVLYVLCKDHPYIIRTAGTAAMASILLDSTDAMVRMAAETITELSEYGKLLLPVMTAALASQGGVTSSTALYMGTAAFDYLLTSLISGILIPATYAFLAVSIGNSAVGEDILKRLRDLIRSFISWTLKTLLTVFTTYIGLTGVVSGTTDAVALKAAKLTISSAVPVVGGILSDASEAVLVSAGLVKNAAGIYGILALLAVFLSPFLKIGLQYLILKCTAMLCSLFPAKPMSDLIEDVSSAMGFLLAMTGAVCLMLLISTICFLKGVG